MPEGGLAADADTTVPVTVVMMTRNRCAQALGTLERLARLQPRPAVIVVDNASEDGTAAAVAGGYPWVRVCELPRNVGACARTVGVRLARTPFVAFSDDDSWWAPGALPTAAGILERHPGIGLVMARVVVEPAGGTDPVCRGMAEAPLGRLDGLPWPRVLGFVACGAVVRRDAFLQVGGFHGLVEFPARRTCSPSTCDRRGGSSCTRARLRPTTIRSTPETGMVGGPGRCAPRW